MPWLRGGFDLSVAAAVCATSWPALVSGSLIGCSAGFRTSAGFVPVSVFRRRGFGWGGRLVLLPALWVGRVVVSWVVGMVLWRLGLS